MIDNPYRSLPSVDRLVQESRLRADGPIDLLTACAREALREARAAIDGGAEAPAFETLIDVTSASVRSALRPPLRPLINATGVILHTNLGRAPLAEEAIEAMSAVSHGYSDLEFELASGKRGSRHAILDPLLTRITGAEAAIAVNNNAAAVLLALAALAAGREVIVGRSELVEIGGGFRIPDVMRQSRARLVEVGTTNRTRAADYAAAMSARTAAIMRVHASNFRIVGFTERPDLAGLADVAHDHAVLLLDDIGSGCLLDTTRYGLAPEPTPQASIAARADLVMFSGDKLLGGPQGGLIVGRRDLVDRLKRHPLARAVRLDKASIAGLAATLRLYVDGRAEERIPVWRMISMPLDTIGRRATAIAREVGAAASVLDGRSMIGGGSLPEESLHTKLVAVAPQPRRGAARIAAALRDRAIVARVEDGRVLLDPRTVDPGDDAALMGALKAALS